MVASEILHDKLQQTFGYASFRQGQEEVIQSVMQSNHTLAMLPTGTGKSLCYQLTGYLMNRTVLIVSPLLSLMQDQVDQMKSNGEKRVVAINSFLNYRERNEILNQLNQYQFIFMSPEMLQNDRIIQILQQLDIGLFVVDEAHCISQWGPDFRTDYLYLGQVREKLNDPVCLALTATANKSVREDIINILSLPTVNEIVYSVDRPNIAIKIDKVKNKKEKENQLLTYVEQIQKPGIIYFSSKKVADEMATIIQSKLSIPTASYHAGLEQEQRILIQQQFLYKQLAVVCATSAFGMGINKSDVRFVIHYHLPTQMESYVQEIGRAGRDGGKSISILLYQDKDEMLPFQLVENELPSNIEIDTYVENLDKAENEKIVLGLDDTDERFLRFYSNKYKNDRDVAYKIKQMKDIRLRVKREKVASMIAFVQSSKCRRATLLAAFGEQQLPSHEQCCDICGLDITEYKGDMTIQPTNAEHNWEKLLQSLLLT